MADLKNNLFYYATKELSQDAFICWLCSYALKDADNSDLKLVECARKLVFEFMKRGIGENIRFEDIALKDVEKQVGNIDVLLTAEYHGKTYKIIVEDKTHTSEHDNQLIRYKDQINDDAEIIGIYFKTGFQSDLSKVHDAGYKVYNREDILALLRACETENAILKSFREYWENFDNLAKCYKELPFNEWPDWQTVNGFYDEMQKKLCEDGLWAGYGYVSNPSGGFWGLWYGPNNDSIETDGFKAVLYLQIEIKWNYSTGRYDSRICTKLEDQSEIKNDSKILELRQAIIEKQNKYGYRKPGRMRWGTVMTVGEYDYDDDNMTYSMFTETILESVKSYNLLMDDLRS